MTKSKLVDEIGNFTAFPNWAIEMGDKIGPHGLVLMLVLRFHSGTNNDIFPSYDTLQRETGLNRHQIAKTIRHLESLNIIERKKRFGKSTIYRIKNLLSPASSADSALLEEKATVVQNQHSISAESALSLVQNQHSNKTQLTRLKEQDDDDDEIDNNSTVLADQFEKTFGTLITPKQDEILKKWCSIYSRIWVDEALEETAKRNGKSMNYTEAILRDWHTNGRKKPRERYKKHREQVRKRYDEGEFAEFILR